MFLSTDVPCESFASKIEKILYGFFPSVVGWNQRYCMVFSLVLWAGIKDIVWFFPSVVGWNQRYCMVFSLVLWAGIKEIFQASMASCIWVISSSVSTE